MKNLIFALFACITLTGSAQFVAKMEFKGEVPNGLCDKNEVYALFPGFEGQVEAASKFSEAEIVKRLNTEVQFLKANPKYKGKGMVSLVFNCKGEIVESKMSIGTKNTELDNQILVVFNSLGEWKPGTLKGKPVDSSQLFSFKIKKGELVFE